MTKAPEEKLNALHGAIAEVLIEQVKHKSQEVSFDEDGNPSAGEEIYDVTPQTLNAAIKFLKDNDITADITQDENLGKLKEHLQKKQKHSRLKSGADAAKLQVV